MAKHLVKICGMKHRDNLTELLALPIDYFGMIFYAQSKRYVDDHIAKHLPTNTVKRVGVFVNEDNENILSYVDRFDLDVIQLHGAESPAQCQALRAQGLTVWKALGIDDTFDYDLLQEYEGKVDIFVFDTKTAQHGGSGTSFDWSALYKNTTAIPYFLSGGLGVDNLEEALSIDDERLIGLDFNSKLETEPGRKDINLVKQVLKILDNHE